MVCLVGFEGTFQADKIESGESTMQHSITQSERDVLTLSLLEHVSPLLQSYAQSANLDFDDLYQDAAVKILTILDTRLSQIFCLSEYIAVSVKHQVLDKIDYSKRRRTVSLDEPLLDDASLTLLDVLPSPYSTDPLVVLLAQERLGELQPLSARHWGTRRMAVELHATAQAIVSFDVPQATAC